MKFTKYHALGNDYIVVDPKHLDHEITSAEIKVICDRHYGMGSDGVLYGPSKGLRNEFMLRIFNPDSSEAEKSGNGLRIFARYLWDCGLVKNTPLNIETKGGDVVATVLDSGKAVSVEMGKVKFTHEDDSHTEPEADEIYVDDKPFTFYRANVGNPHCVIPLAELSRAAAEKYGPLIERDLRFANRTNIQFMKILDRNNIQIEIWERGAGYTFASGTSATASASVAYKLGLCDSNISVHMPGGVIDISLNDQCLATMSGAVCRIGEGELENEALYGI